MTFTECQIQIEERKDIMKRFMALCTCLIVAVSLCACSGTSGVKATQNNLSYETQHDFVTAEITMEQQRYVESRENGKDILATEWLIQMKIRNLTDETKEHISLENIKLIDENGDIAGNGVRQTISVSDLDAGQASRSSTMYAPLDMVAVEINGDAFGVRTSPVSFRMTDQFTFSEPLVFNISDFVSEDGGKTYIWRPAE